MALSALKVCFFTQLFIELTLRDVAMARYIRILYITGIFNPRRMREGYGSHSVCLCVCVCLSVCYRTSGYIPCLYVESRVPLGFSWLF